MTLRAAVRTQLRAHPRLAADAAEVLRRVGLRRQATRLDRATAIVSVSPSQHGGRPFRMWLLDGTDQIAAAMAADGWLSFERPLPDVFAGLASVARDGFILDIGANTGFYSLLARSVNRLAHVVAFEPYPPVLPHLRRNLELNGATEVRVSEVAIGRTAGTALLYVPASPDGRIETSCSLNPEFRDGDVSTIEVEVATLDGWIATHGASPVAVVKIDVESAEHDVLAGAPEVLERDRPLVVVEVLPNSDAGALDAIRKEHRYVDIRLRPDQAIVHQSVAFDGNAWNHLWAPEERLSEALAIGDRCGLSVID